MKPVVASVNWPWAVCLAKPLAVRLINMEKKNYTITPQQIGAELSATDLHIDWSERCPAPPLPGAAMVHTRLFKLYVVLNYMSLSGVVWCL